MKRWIIGIIILIVIGLIGWFGYNRYRQNKEAETIANYQVVKAERGDLVATIGATGQVYANQTAYLSWQTSGTVEWVGVKSGDKVKAGQILATLVQTSLAQNVILAQAELINAEQALEDLYDTSFALAQAENNLVKMEKAVEDAQDYLDALANPASQADIDSARASVTLAKDQLDKARERYEPYENKPEENLIRASLLNQLSEAQKKYDAAVRRLNNLTGAVNDTTVKLAQAELDFATAKLLEAQKEVDRLKLAPEAKDITAFQTRIAAAEATINLARLIAPFTASITEVTIKPGDQVNLGSRSFRLDDLSRLIVDVRVTEVDVNRIQSGQQVSITFDAIPNQEYQGRVTDVSAVGTATQGVVEFLVSVELSNPDQNVRPGMTAAVNFVVEQIEDVLMVPNRAVRIVEGKRVVYILVGEEAEEVEVRLGASSETMSQVLDDNLKKGDLIILNPPTLFDTEGPPPFVSR